MKNKIDISPLSADAKQLVVTIAKAKRHIELKHRSKSFPESKRWTKEFGETVAREAMCELPDQEQRVFFDMMLLPIGKMFWIPWLVGYGKHYPKQVPLLRYIFEASLPIPDAMDRPHFQVYLQQLPPAEKFDLRGPWWHSMNPPLSSFCDDRLSKGLCAVDGRGNCLDFSAMKWDFGVDVGNVKIDYEGAYDGKY